MTMVRKAMERPCKLLTKPILARKVAPVNTTGKASMSSESTFISYPLLFGSEFGKASKNWNYSMLSTRR